MAESIAWSLSAGTGAKRQMTGPILLFGAAIKMFATDLSVVKAHNTKAHNTRVHNTSADTAATLSILIGMDAVTA